ncbi:porin [Shewanella indica]|jgi:predicted porin|uniref:Porin n=1 Tax=Shewanella indica TaxID=768528 RepID=A0ABU4QAH8_9GAMM|nr:MULTISPECIES: porin [Shewanella]MCE9791541.1 porin [Shewanella indica]MDX6016417.1 porin [Shewanella indica]OIN14585.1 porin [Shewanella algae]
MKKLPLAITALAAFSGAVSAAPTLYGRLDYSVTHSDSGSATHKAKSGTVLENNFTRLGVRGQNDLGSDWQVFYQIELGVNAAAQDAGDKPVSARSTFLGLRHQEWGSLAAGRMEPVFKMTKGFVDVFDNYSMKHDRLMAGDKRWGDSLEYRTPNWRGWQLGVSYLLEDNHFDTDDARRDNGNFQLALSWGDKRLKQGDLYLAAAYSDGVEDIKAWRLVGHWKLQQLKLGTLIQHSELVNPAKPQWQAREGTGFFVSASYQLDKLMLKAQYGRDDSGTGLIATRIYEALGQAAQTVPEVSQWGIGAEYQLSKSTRVHTEIGQFDAKGYSDFDDTITSIGLRYDF